MRFDLKIIVRRNLDGDIHAFNRLRNITLEQIAASLGGISAQVVDDPHVPHVIISGVDRAIYRHAVAVCDGRYSNIGYNIVFNVSREYLDSNCSVLLPCEPLSIDYSALSVKGIGSFLCPHYRILKLESILEGDELPFLSPASEQKKDMYWIESLPGAVVSRKMLNFFESKSNFGVKIGKALLPFKGVIANDYWWLFSSNVFGKHFAIEASKKCPQCGTVIENRLDYKADPFVAAAAVRNIHIFRDYCAPLPRQLSYAIPGIGGVWRENVSRLTYDIAVTSRDYYEIKDGLGDYLPASPYYAMPLALIDAIVGKAIH